MGRLLLKTDPLGNTTSYEYDGANNRTAVINAFVKRFEFEYDDHNNLIKAIDPRYCLKSNEIWIWMSLKTLRRLLEYVFLKKP